jgi:hypothetical protein
MRDFIQAIGRAAPEATEQRDGRTCWRFTTSRDGKSMRVWLDTQTHFPYVPKARCLTINDSSGIIAFSRSTLNGTAFNTLTPIRLFLCSPNS